MPWCTGPWLWRPPVLLLAASPVVQNQCLAEELHNIVYKANSSSPRHLQDVNVNDFLLTDWLSEII